MRHIQVPPLSRAAGLLALLVAGLPALAPAQGMGRLLMTPEQRADLGRTRLSQAAGARGDAALSPTPPVPAAAASAPAGLTVAPIPQRVEGWVLRADGRSTVWVDGMAYYGFDTQGPARDALARRGLLAAGSAAGALEARPGQTLQDPAARRTTDLLPEGALRIRRAPAAEAAGRRGESP